MLLSAFRALCGDSVLREHRLLEEFRQLVVGLPPEIFPVVPFRLLRVELRPVHHHPLKRKRLDEFRHREEFAVVSRIPSEHRQHVHESLREISVLAVAA